MAFAKKEGAYEIIKEGNEEVMRIEYGDKSFPPFLEDSKLCMADTIDKIIEAPQVTRVIFTLTKNYQYDAEQVSMLREVANLYVHLVKQKKVLSFGTFDVDYSAKYGMVQYIVLNLFKGDPLGAYVEVKRLIREQKIKMKDLDEQAFRREKEFLDLLIYIYDVLDKTKLIGLAKSELDGYEIGDRTLYRKVFRAIITPNFLFTRLMAEPPLDDDEVDTYSVDGIDVMIFKMSGDVRYKYHVVPPEFKIDEEKHILIDIARNVLAEHKPEAEEFIDPDKMRYNFFNIGRDLLSDVAEHKGIELSYEEAEELARILVRYTVGFGLIEVLLQDPKIQDITVNGPIGETPIFVVHEDYGECVTNIIPSREDGEGWATRFRLVSGRPLDEANPVLDTGLTIPGARARVAIITNPLNPYGLGYSFRRHRDKPWTLPLFINNRMMNSLTAGMISFLVDGAKTVLVAGSRGSGKTSILGSVMVELMRRYRVITLEDTLELPVDFLRKQGYNIQPMKVRSALTHGGGEMAADEGIRTSLRMGDSSLIVGEVRSSIRGNEEVVIVENGETKRIPIKDLEDKDLSNVYVPTLDFNLKTSLRRLVALVKHPVRKRLLEVKTKTGRKVVVTPDHSLFTVTRDLKIAPIECKDLKVCSQIVIPSVIPCGFNDLNEINLLDELSNLRIENFEQPVREAISKIGWRKATEVCDIQSGDIYNYFRKNQKTNIPITSFKKLMMETETLFEANQLLIKTGTSNVISAVLPINEDFCSFLGYYISEGYYENKNGGKIIITNSDERVLNHVIELYRGLFNIEPKRREVFGAGKSVQLSISCKPLVDFISKLEIGRTCTEKRIPSFIFGLSKKKIAAFLRTLYEGDGSITVSEKSGNSIRYCTTSEKLAEDVVYSLLVFGIVARIYPAKKKEGSNQLWVVEFKDRSMVETFMEQIGFMFKDKEIGKRSWAHTKVNTVYFDKDFLRKNLIKYPRRYRHLFRFLRCSKNYLKRVVNDPECVLSQRLKLFAESDIYLDEVKEIKETNLIEGEHVYDLSVEPTQNFIGGFGGILLHNTEAKALYEAMRIGSLSNVVAGTIHGESPYGVFDRVVNDLGVPRTSFKATDVIIVANPIKTADRLSSVKRVVSLTEVRKEWEEDPLKEGAFVDLLKYNVKSDQLEATQDLINGDSDIVKAIASNVKEWAGNWDSVWNNIILRAKTKQLLVDYANRSKNLGLLEAGFVIKANDHFHRVCESVTEEVGYLDNKRILFEWTDWLKRQMREIIR